MNANFGKQLFKFCYTSLGIQIVFCNISIHIYIYNVTRNSLLHYYWLLILHNFFDFSFKKLFWRISVYLFFAKSIVVYLVICRLWFRKLLSFFFWLNRLPLASPFTSVFWYTCWQYLSRTIAVAIRSTLRCQLKTLVAVYCTISMAA